MNRLSTLTLVLSVTLGMDACTTADPYSQDAQVNDKAIVEGFSPIQAILYTPIDINTVVIDAIDGHSLGMTDSRVMLPPGAHNFEVWCQMPVIPAIAYAAIGPPSGRDTVSFTAEAGHHYKFSPERNGTHSCISVVYDMTNGEPTQVAITRHDNAQH